jgi:hypothetical protein
MTDMQLLERFAKLKGLPVPGRVAGGGGRRVYHAQPERVQVIRGRDIGGTRKASSLPDETSEISPE